MSITSKTDICNLSLDLLSGGIINDADNPSTSTEELMDRWYELNRKRLLREHPWNFAIKRALLAASSTDPAFGYTKAFPVPNDFIRLLNIENDDGQILQTTSYEVEDGSVLISTEATSLSIRYVYDIQDVTRFDPMFIDLLAYDIALSVAYKVTESNGNVQRVAELQKMRGSIARAIDGQERPPTRIERSKSRAARLYGRSSNADRVIF